ncbi:hypothetical protein [Streptomyces beihaiensis]|uniref:Uncharacterized protein n=1 Tax=Streptomyces beihaiensis TaxID=2984495 RepID=A0ABT3TQ01_9ACTN|nr:hypothetical protein [Streptomyces beihaiensis]MCX3058591.1 hypothetical protein [Streptomyces beihaiensis]
MADDAGGSAAPLGRLIDRHDTVVLQGLAAQRLAADVSFAAEHPRRAAGAPDGPGEGAVTAA